MGIIGQRPESGVRITVERGQQGSAPWRYKGTASTPAADFSLDATIDAKGEVKVVIGAGAPPDLAEKIRLILRAAHRHTAEGGAAPARKIVRWRAEK